MGNPIMKWFCMFSCLIAALAAINVGLCPFGFDFFKTEFVMMNMAGFVAILHYIILAAGIISLACFVMCCMGNCGHSCKSSCK